ncbi:hypothetical protein EV426DRAFT_576905 [Tirmania nivea]|nr:hypothetical protein EV426DRAFT_576905 [Tirmania nivea]
MYYICLITFLLGLLAGHVVSQTMTTTTTTPTSTFTLITPIDLDAVLQGSINYQVLAEMGAERASHQPLHRFLGRAKSDLVLQYCLTQYAVRQAARQTRLDYQLFGQLSQLTLMKRVRWADGWVDSDLEESSTDAGTIVTMPDSECGWQDWNERWYRGRVPPH